MTLLEVDELMSYWLDHPPPHLMIAAYLGKRQTRQVPRLPRQVEACPDPVLAQLAAKWGAGFTSGDVHKGLGPVVLDFAELRLKTEGKG